MRFSAVKLGLLIAGTHALAQAPETVAPEDRHQQVKERYLETEQAERQILGTLYSINQRMKDMSKRRDRLTDRKLAVEGDVRMLARNIAELERRLDQQKTGLSRRMRELYLIHGQSAIRSLFSAQSALEFDRNVKFLRRVTDRDYGLIKDYERSLKTLRVKRRQLDNQVRRLVRLQNELKNQEVRLTREQETKGTLLEKLKTSRDRQLNELKDLRQAAGDGGGNMDTAFFEKRGSLPPPVSAAVVKDYGFIQDEDYRFRIAHKGLHFSAQPGEAVRAVFPGRAAFVGELPGYGLSVILDHGDHYYTVYAHLLNVKVRMNQAVEGEAPVGEAGGKSPWFGTGMYFEVRHFSDAIDPQPWLKGSI